MLEVRSCASIDICYIEGACMTVLAQKTQKIAALLRLKQLRCKFADCPICGPTVLVKLADNAVSVRCVRCGSSAIHMSIVKVIREVCPDLSNMTVYEMSSRGPLFEYLQRRATKFVYSEYFGDMAFGAFKNGIQCQDVQRLTYSDRSFDLCTSTEVFEHVPDDMKGFREVCRVLRPGGRFVFTVPLSDASYTVERVQMLNGKIHHLKPAEYHGDAIRGLGRVLCFRNYGRDIVDRLLQSGFVGARLVNVDDSRWWCLGKKVVVAEK